MNLKSLARIPVEGKMKTNVWTKGLFFFLSFFLTLSEEEGGIRILNMCNIGGLCIHSSFPSLNPTERKSVCVSTHIS